MKEACKKYCLLILIIVLALAGMLYYGNRKEGYHVDEMFSYGLANSEYLPFMHFGENEYDVKDWMLEYGAGESLADLCRNLIKDFGILKDCGFRFKESVIYQAFLLARENSADTRTTTWVSGQLYQDYLSVSESNTFNYFSVYYNQRGDVHPPLYYIFLHTVCSVFQGSFSKWYALSINMLFLILTIVLLYRMAERHFGGRWMALAATAVYGLSIGLITSAVYLRMYAVLTFMTLFFLYGHIEEAENGFEIKGKGRRRLILGALLGFLTHYYFVVYAVALAVVFVIWMCCEKRWRAVFRYLTAMASAAVIGLCVWPYAIRHVFGGYRGYEAFQVVANREFYLIKLKFILYQIGQQLFGGQGQWVLLPMMLILTVILAIVNRKKKNYAGKAMLLLIPGTFYCVLISQIVPLYVERYFMNLFPLCSLLTVFCAREVPMYVLGRGRISETKAGRQREKIGMVTASVAALVFVLLNNGVVNLPNYLYLDGQETATVPEGADCVYVLQDGSWNSSAVDSCILARCRRVGLVYVSELECLSDGYEYKPDEWVIVAVSEELETDEVVNEVKNALGLTAAAEEFRENGSTSTRVYLKVQ